MFRKTLILFILIISSFNLKSQEAKKFKYDIAYGINLKCNFGQYESSFSLSSSFGVVMKGLKRAVNYSGFSPNAGVVLTLNNYIGGIGTSFNDNLNLSFNNFRNPLYLDVILTPFLDIGHDKQPLRQELKPMKLFNQMSEFIPLLYNEYSLVLGSNFVMNFGRNRFQQIGVGLLNINRFQFCYFNDGPIYNKWYGGFTGDGQDRFWTGGGYLRFYLIDNNLRDFTISFERFTASCQDQFDIASIFGLNHVPVPLELLLLNRGKVTIETTFKNNFKVIVTPFIGDYRLDFQNLIHKYISNNPFHVSVVKTMWQFGLGYSRIK